MEIFMKMFYENIFLSNLGKVRKLYLSFYNPCNIKYLRLYQVYQLLKLTQLTFTCSKSTLEKKGVKYVQS